jgi:hypothetical protein
MSMSDALSSWVPVAAASSSAARVVPLVKPAVALHFQLMVVWCVVESDSGGNGEISAETAGLIFGGWKS